MFPPPSAAVREPQNRITPRIWQRVLIGRGIGKGRPKGPEDESPHVTLPPALSRAPCRRGALAMGARDPEAAAGLGFAPLARVARARTRGNCPQKYSARNRLKWYRYSVLKSYGASEKLRIESYAAPITPHRKLRRPRPLPYTPSYPPCASGRHGARSAPQGLSYTTRRQ